MSQPAHQFFARNVLSLTGIKLGKSVRGLRTHPFMNSIAGEFTAQCVTNQFTLAGIKAGVHFVTDDAVERRWKRDVRGSR